MWGWDTNGRLPISDIRIYGLICILPPKTGPRSTHPQIWQAICEWIHIWRTKRTNEAELTVSLGYFILMVETPSFWESDQLTWWMPH